MKELIKKTLIRVSREAIAIPDSFNTWDGSTPIKEANRIYGRIKGIRYTKNRLEKRSQQHEDA